MARRMWTEADLDILVRRYPHERTADVAAAVGRGERCTYAKAASMGLRKSAEFMSSAKSGRILRGKKDPRMMRSQFGPGNVPWNKGMAYRAGGRSAETRFKPGARSVRWDPEIYCVGALRITSDNDLQVKMAPGGYGTWVSLARYAWKLKTGRWPPKHMAVARINGDHYDVRPENLELRSRARMMRDNSVHTKYPTEFARLVQLRGAITRIVNRITRESES